MELMQLPEYSHLNKLINDFGPRITSALRERVQQLLINVHRVEIELRSQEDLTQVMELFSAYRTWCDANDMTPSLGWKSFTATFRSLVKTKRTELFLKPLNCVFTSEKDVVVLRLSLSDKRQVFVKPVFQLALHLVLLDCAFDTGRLGVSGDQSLAMDAVHQVIVYQTLLMSIQGYFMR